MAKKPPPNGRGKLSNPAQPQYMTAPKKSGPAKVVKPMKRAK